MRIFIVLLLVTGIGGAGTGQDARGEDTERTLIELLASEKFLAYHRSPDSGTLEVKLLSDELIRESQAYYASRSENLAEYHDLEKQRRFLERERLAQAAGQLPPRANRAALLDAVKTRTERVSRPTGRFRVGAVTRRGADFIGVQELGTSHELLIPVYQIKHVIMRPMRAEPAHATEPADEPQTNGMPSPPAR